jgi:hypothetical protein
MLSAKIILVAIGASAGAAVLGFIGHSLGNYLETKLQGRHVADVFGGLAFFWGVILGGFTTAYFLFD